MVEDVSDAGRADAVLFAVKSWQTETAARALAPALGPECSSAANVYRCGIPIGKSKTLFGSYRFLIRMSWSKFLP